MHAALPKPIAGTGSRTAYIDHLRILLTALVILHHTAIAYGGSGSWYWREFPDFSSLPLVLFNTVNQSYFMGFFFLLAGFYTPGPFERKGTWGFLRDRFTRLGIPLLVYFLVIGPATIAIVRTADGVPFLRGWWEMTVAHQFHPGPLWFAEALLIFAVVYAGWRAVRPSGLPGQISFPGHGVLAIAAVLAGCVSFAVRLAIPVGADVLWLQLGYFPCYILLFAAGCLVAGSSSWLNEVSWTQARPWALTALILVAALPVIIMTRGDKGAFTGGMTVNALIYALWDPPVAWGFILALLWLFRTWLDAGNRLTSWLARRAYGAFILHPPVVVGITLLLRSWSAPQLLKFGIASAAACIASVLVASAALSIPGARRVL